MTNLVRDDPSDFHFKSSGKSHKLAFKRSGDIADVIVFGFAADSSLVNGRTYRTMNQRRLVKGMDVILIERDGERVLSMLSMAAGAERLALRTTKDGGVTFATMHTLVDEFGDAIRGAH